MLVVEVREDGVLLALVPYPLLEWRSGIVRETLSSEVYVLYESPVHKRDTHIRGFLRRASGIVLAFLCELVSVSTCCYCMPDIVHLLQVQAS